MVLDTNGSVLIRSILNVYVGMWLELYCKLALNDYERNFEQLGYGLNRSGSLPSEWQIRTDKGGSVCGEYASWHGLPRILADFHRNVLLAIRICYLV